MFGSKRNASSINEDVETVVGKETQFKGNLTSKGSIRVDGKVDGDIFAAGSAVIGQSGDVNAQIKAANCTVAGQVHGNVEVTERLELLPTAKLYGDIKVGTLIIAEGAVFKGGCGMQNGNAGTATKKQQQQ